MIRAADHVSERADNGFKLGARDAHRVQPIVCADGGEALFVVQQRSFAKEGAGPQSRDLGLHPKLHLSVVKDGVEARRRTVQYDVEYVALVALKADGSGVLGKVWESDLADIANEAEEDRCGAEQRGRDRAKRVRWA